MQSLKYWDPLAWCLLAVTVFYVGSLCHWWGVYESQDGPSLVQWPFTIVNGLATLGYGIATVRHAQTCRRDRANEVAQRLRGRPR